MKEIGEYLSTIQKTEAKSQWSDLVGRFVDAYNLGEPEKYRISHVRMAVKLSPLKKANGIGWLEWFYNDCKKQPNFGKYFNWSINSKNSVTHENTPS